MIEGLAIVDIGVEEFCKDEAKEFSCNATPLEGCVVIHAKDLPTLAAFTYQTQTANRVIFLLGRFNANDLETLKTTISELKLPSFIKSDIKSNTFRVDCERHGDHGFGSMDVESDAGEWIIKSTKMKGASMKHPDIVFFVYINDDKGYLGIDLTGKNIGKRQYKIYQQAGTVKGPLAYAAVRESKFREGMTLLDPFSGVGTIPIEAALFSTRLSPNFFTKEFLFTKYIDSAKLWKKLDARSNLSKQGIYSFDKELRMLRSTQKNAKIAGVEKCIETSKIDIEWLDTRLAKHSIDCIVTQPPEDSKRGKDMEAIYKEFFYQARFVLKKNGNIVLLVRNPTPFENLASEVISRKSIFSGLQEFFLLKVKP